MPEASLSSTQTPPVLYRLIVSYSVTSKPSQQLLLAKPGLFVTATCYVETRPQDRLGNSSK